MNKDIDTFLEDMRLNNAAPGTISHYRRYLSEIFRATPNADNITIESIREFKSSKQVSSSTLSYYMIALRSFLRWMARNNHACLSAEAVEVPKQTAKKRSFLSSTQVERLLNEPTSLRDKAILSTLYSTGLRVSELVSLNRPQNLSEITIIGKGGKERLVFLSPKTQETLKNYLKGRTDSCAAMFVAMGGAERLKVRAIQTLLKKYSDRVGCKASPHTMRHSMATDLLRKGADLRSIQELLGHKSISTTQIYTHITNSALRETFSKFHSDI